MDLLSIFDLITGNIAWKAVPEILQLLNMVTQNMRHCAQDVVVRWLWLTICGNCTCYLR